VFTSTSLHRESQHRTVLSKALTEGSEMNVWTSTGSYPCDTPGRWLRSGARNTTRSDPTAAWKTWHRRNLLIDF